MQADLVETYTKALGLFYLENQNPEYSNVVEVDLSLIEPSIAGPAKPQDRIELKELKSKIHSIHSIPHDSHEIDLNGRKTKICNGNIVIAAITSCTNTSNPYGLIGAALLAKSAVDKGLKVPPYVKTSFAPGSRVVTRYLKDADLMKYLEALGFHLTAFGCTTCIGNSGPLLPEIEKVISDHNMNVASVLSGNRNFEARIHQKVKENYLASPMLVIAFALAGRIDIDLTTEPISFDTENEPIFLKDIWPDTDKIDDLVEKYVKTEFYEDEYGRILSGDDFWHALKVNDSTTYNWDESSSYINNPPYFNNFDIDFKEPADIESARALLLLGDTITTDHISPAGAIPEHYPAGKYLTEKNIPVSGYNSYGARRGNHEVMLRGTFGNIRIKNKMTHPKEGSYTLKFPNEKKMFIFDAAMEYSDENIPLIVLAGSEYGTGSSRDWAAKGTFLLGVKAVIAESYERIHRSNLEGMGVLPLEFLKNEGIDYLGLNGSEEYSIKDIHDITPGQTLQVGVTGEVGVKTEFKVIVRLDTNIEVAYYNNGGILHYVLRKLINEK